MLSSRKGIKGFAFFTLLSLGLLQPQTYALAATSLEQLQKAANQGDSKAQGQLGHMYLTGSDVEQDDKLAFAWHLKAAMQGQPASQYFIGYMYNNGQGVAKDPKKAVHWYRKSAEQGRADAEFALGYAYAYGQGVPKNAKTAFEWYSKAANHGHDMAQYVVGRAYSNGEEGAQKDVRQAVFWFRKSAEQGYESAQYSLGTCYASGIGVPQDFQQAYVWLSVAAANGDAHAPKARDDIAKRLSEEKLTHAQKEAALYFQKFHPPG